MAEEAITKWWSVGAKEEETARKYLSFLHKHSMFGGHVGLPENIRNVDPNRSLDSARGIYDMVEVYSLSGTSCPTGTVVNFELENPVNPLGKTYVYPCNDVSKPMGYMVTKAEPNIWGVCVVSGILEVPLVYLRNTSFSELERKDYVQYDLDAKAFKFSDSGFPVFNVYQDVDGDWIAIILFGNTSAEDSKYSGPFATSVATISTITDPNDSESEISVVYINVADGDVVFQGTRYHCPGLSYNTEDLSSNFYLTAGESLWLRIDASGNTPSFGFRKYTYNGITGAQEEISGSSQNNGSGSSLPGGDVLSGGGDNGGSSLPGSDILSGEGDSGSSSSGESSGETGEELPIDTGTVFYKKIAECDSNLKIRQIQYGNIFYNGVGYPDYYALCGNGTPLVETSTLLRSIFTGINSSGYSGSGSGYSTSGVGVTYVIPVPGNAPIQVWTDSISSIDTIVFSPNYNASGSHQYKYLQANSSEWITPASGGWVRISVLDEGISNGSCIRFYCNNEDWSSALPLFRCGNYGGFGEAGYQGGWEYYIGYPDYAALCGNGTEIDPYVPQTTDASGSGYVSASGNGYVSASGGYGGGIHTGWEIIPTGSGWTFDSSGLGMGVTFLLPVPSSATISWYSDAPECINFATFAPFLGSTGGSRYHYLTQGDSYTTPEGGWVCISVLDNRAYPNGNFPYGACLRFYMNGIDYTSSLPLFRHGGSDIKNEFEYSGPFKVSIAYTYENEENEATYNLSIADGCGRYANGRLTAGYVVEGTGSNEGTQVPVFYDSITGCRDGQEVYLVHSSSGYDFVAVDRQSNGVPALSSVASVASSDFDFALMIAYISSGKIVQVQYGDVTVPSRRLKVVSVNSGTISVGIDGCDSSNDVVKFIQGTNVTITGNVATKEITISATEDSSSSGGSTFYVPNYDMLSLATQGTAPNVGLGHTFVLPVKAGNVAFYDDGGCAKGVWTNIAGTTTYPLVNKTLYNAPSDGWIRVSVVDNGTDTTSGKCISIYNSTGTVQVYKYSPSFSVYNGSFKASCVLNAGGTTYTVTIEDGYGRKDSQNRATAGFVVEGTGTGSSTQIPVLKYTSNARVDGDKIYLVHSELIGYDFEAVSSNADVSSDYDFAVLIAYINSGKMVQVQYGDVTVPSRKLKVTNVSAGGNGTVSVGVYGSSEVVKFVGGTDINVTGSTTNGTITIGLSGSLPTGGFPPPDYSKLCRTDFSTPVPNAQGISFILPVQQGHTIGWYTDGGTVIAKYAPSSGSSQNLVKGDYNPAPSDGWVRITVFDDGTTPNCCVSFVDNSHWTPLYKFKSGGSGDGYGSYSGYGGGVRYPNYASLTNDSTGSLASGTTYYVDSGGWLRVSAVGGGSTCCFVTIDDSYSIGLGNTGSNTSGNTWLLPIDAGHRFFVGNGATLIKFDGSCHQYSSSKGVKSYSSDSEEEEDVPILRKSQDIMAKYTDNYGFEDDYDIIKEIAIEAENSKDEVANLCRALYSHNRSFVVLSNRCELSAIHAEELCDTASSLYQDALDTKEAEEAQAYLDEANHYAESANTWINNTLDYMATMESTYNSDKKTEYDKLGNSAVENTSKCYEDAVAENEKLLVIGVDGGEVYVANTERCIREANEWYSSMTEELNNEDEVYSSSYKVSSDAYTDVNDVYAKLMTKCNEAVVYVSNLSKPANTK